MLIGVAAFVGRVIYVVTTTNHQALTTDEIYFISNARSLAAGHGFKFSALIGAAPVDNAAHPPLTALVLAPTATITDSNLALRLTVAFAGVGTVVLVGVVGRKLAGPRAGLIAAAIAALYPALWSYDGLVLSETFSAITTALVMLLAYRLVSDPSWLNALGTGVACGLAMLSRSELLVFVPVLVVMVLARITTIDWSRRTAVAGIMVVASAATVGPWVGYNLSRFEKPVFLTYPGGVLLGANCRSTYYGPLIGSWNGFCTVQSNNPDPSVVEAEKQRRALSYVRAHLSRVPVVVAARIGRVWSVYRLGQIADYEAANGVPKWATWSGWAMYLVLGVLTVAGAVSLARRRVTLLPIIAPFVVATLTAAAFYGRPRFRIPAEVSIAILAAVALDAFVNAAQTEGSDTSNLVRRLVPRRAR